MNILQNIKYLEIQLDWGLMPFDIVEIYAIGVTDIE